MLPLHYPDHFFFLFGFIIFWCFAAYKVFCLFNKPFYSYLVCFLIEMDLSKISFNQGEIKSLGGRLNLVPSFLLIDLIRKMRANYDSKVWLFYYDYVKSSAMKHGFSVLESEEVKKWLTEENVTKAQVFEKMLGLVEAYGFGLASVQSNNLPKEAFVELSSSSIALSVKEFRGESSKPVCVYVSAFLAGLASAVYGESLDCIEQKCMVSGEDKCLFKLFPRSESFENIFLEQQGLSTAGKF